VTDSYASVAILGNTNVTTIRQTNGSNLFASQDITGDTNTVLTDQDGNDHWSTTTIVGSLNDVNVIQRDSGQVSTVDLLSGSDGNTITVDQSAVAGNTSEIDFANADFNNITHTQSTNGPNLATTSMADSNNNVVNVTQN